jgi:hypothetical protein
MSQWVYTVKHMEQHFLASDSGVSALTPPHDAQKFETTPAVEGVPEGGRDVILSRLAESLHCALSVATGHSLLVI